MTPQSPTSSQRWSVQKQRSRVVSPSWAARPGVMELGFACLAACPACVCWITCFSLAVWSNFCFPWNAAVSGYARCGRASSGIQPHGWCDSSSPCCDPGLQLYEPGSDSFSSFWRGRPSSVVQRTWCSWAPRTLRWSGVLSSVV